MSNLIIGTIGMLAISGFILFFLEEIKRMIKEEK